MTLWARVARIGVAALVATHLGCAVPKQGLDAVGDPPKPVHAVVETRVTTDSAVDADDPALWADARDPARALLFATDKSDGLYVHDLDGSVRAFFPDGPLNNVDLRSDFEVDGKKRVLVAASDRRQFGIRLYLLDPDTLATERYGFIPTDIGEPYGFCVGRVGELIYAIVGNKQGELLQVRIEATAQGPVGTVVRTLSVGSQPEGCVVDDEAQYLYLGEEDVGVWRFDLDPGAEAEPIEVARVDNHRLKADVEGLALLQDGAEKYLIVSSQGDSTFPVFRIAGSRYEYVGRFAVVAGARIDAVTETDGVSAWSGPIGRYPNGLIAMHDDEDAPHAGQQNYKLVDWRDVKQALGLR